ncbi:MAG: hypothetical protein NVS3B25_33620 [Hymenobacter sp.]
MAAPWLLPALLTAAGAFRAVHDTLTHSPDHNRLLDWAAGTRLAPWVDVVNSWKNKYKDPNAGFAPRFWGATTVFVACTDLWHFSNLLAWGCADAAVLVGAWTPYRWWAVGAVVARRLVFEPVYAFLRR